MKSRYDFYKKVLEQWIPDRQAPILVCGGGREDRDTFLAAGFRNVTITNVDERTPRSCFAPYAYIRADIEDLPFKDGEFGFVVAHAVLHHTSSPHRSLLEMYRVAGVAAIAIEARDSLLMRLLVAARMVHPYEIQAVYMNDATCGGWNNSCIPNYVYRWTEREVNKTISTFAPHARHEISYLYGTHLPGVLELDRAGKLKMLILRGLQPIHLVFSKIFPRQQNLFAFRVKKPALKEDLFPWLVMENGAIRFNGEYARRRFRQEREPHPRRKDAIAANTPDPREGMQIEPDQCSDLNPRG